MKPGKTLRSLAALALIGSGCASTSPYSCPEELTRKICSSPALLVEEANVALAGRDEITGYERLTLIRKLHPDSPEATEVYAVTARLYKRQFYRHRLQRDTMWHTTEPEFMFLWLESFFVGDEFPRKRVYQLLEGMPYAFGKRFLAFAKTRPALARWPMEIFEDDGKIVRVRGGVPKDA